MTQAGWYKTDEWWDMMDMFDDPKRDKQLERDQTEVWNEMIAQDLETRPAQRIAEEWGIHWTHVYRRAKKVR